MPQGESLFLSYRIPYPPNKGDKIRSWHILRHILQYGPVHVGALVDDPADLAHIGFLQGLAASSCFSFLSRRQKIGRMVRGLASGQALSVAVAQDKALQHWMHSIMTSRPITRIFVFSGQMGGYAMAYRGTGATIVMDFVDVDSEKWQQYADSAFGIKRYIYGREARLMRAEEIRLAQASDASLFVSPAEAELFCLRTKLSKINIHAKPNGVDIDYFDPSAFTPPHKNERPLLVFTGAMDYRANIEAMRWFVTHVWPLVRSGLPDARLRIVGSNPSSEILAFHGNKGIEVTGRVDDVRPHIAGAHVAIAPLQIARGIQNKVLEAMAMARPVVATPQAFEGIEAEIGRHALVEAAPAAMARAIIGLVDHPAHAEKIGEAARAHVRHHYHWRHCLARLDVLIGQRLSETL